MNNKELFAINEDDIEVMDNSRIMNLTHYTEYFQQAKLDAEQIVKDKCIALIDELEKTYSNGEYLIIGDYDLEKIKEKL